MPEAMNIDFLIRAAENNEKLTLFHKTESGKTLTFGSRFFEINPKKKYIIIDRPYGEGETYQQLVRKDKVTGFFIEKGFRFLFHSQVLKRDKYKLQGEKEIPVFIIKMPQDIYDGERRNFFRVPIPVDPPITVKYVSYFESNQSFDEQESPDLAEYNMSGALLHDLSGGGISIISREGMGLMVGDIINMRFPVRHGGEEVQIEGLINNSRKAPDKVSNLKGIEFIPDRSDAYREAIKRISRYVMERQRAMINPYAKD
jgi:c-di-GMP-binding flagellar brake protein YcgR